MINPYIAEVTAFAFNWAPVDWLHCKGQLVSVQQYTPLFAVIGNFFGGDGRTTFGLPNFPPITTGGGSFCIATAGTAPIAPRNALPGETTIFTYQKQPAPPGWADANGELLQISQHPNLFKVLGTKFGGDGINTFGVPYMDKIPPFNVAGNYGFSAYFIVDVPLNSTDQGFMGEVKIFPATAPPAGALTYLANRVIAFRG